MEREDIEAIAKEVASYVTGMRCACKNLNPIFFSAIEKDIQRWGAPGSPENQELQASLAALAKDCGYVRDSKGDWVQFPEQEKALRALDIDYEVIKEHDDGDLTIRIPVHNAEAVVTTEGEIFTRPSNPSAKTGEVYKVDNIEVTIKYIRPGVHEVSFLAPKEGVSEETAAKIDKLIKEKTDISEKESNPSRVHFDRADIDSAIGAAKRLKSDSDLYVFATYLGYTVEKRTPPGMQQYVVVHPDGSTETIKASVGGNPAKEPWQIPLEEYALEKGARPDWVKAGYGETYRSHKRAVERAVSEGKPVPTEVLADYPDLRTREGAD